MQVDFIKREGTSRGAGFNLSINLLIRKLLIIFPTTIPIIGCIIDFRGKNHSFGFFFKIQATSFDRKRHKASNWKNRGSQGLNRRTSTHVEIYTYINIYM